MFDTNRFSEIEANPSRFRLLEQIPFSAEDSFPIKLREAVGDEVVLALLDFETTGFTAGSDEVIEIGLVQVAYSPSLGKITEIIEITSQLECPKQTISELITSITGISNEMVAGKRIDDAHVARIVNNSNVLIAHNAQFDRAFFDIRFPEMANKVWACSVKDVDWRGARSSPDDLFMEIKHFVKTNLGESVPTLASTAKNFCLSSTDFQRELKNKGFSFNDILKITRKELALKYIGETDMKLTEVAFALGYSELSAFSRAFKYWTNMFPQQYRQLSLQDIEQLPSQLNATNL